jgi:hypothetical protein
VRDFEALSRPIALVAVLSLTAVRPSTMRPCFSSATRHVQTTLDGSAASWRRHTQAHARWTMATCMAMGLAQGQALRMSWNPSWPCVRIEAGCAAFPVMDQPGWGRPSQGRETFRLSLRQTN